MLSQGQDVVRRQYPVSHWRICDVGASCFCDNTFPDNDFSMLHGSTGRSTRELQLFLAGPTCFFSLTFECSKK